MTQIERVWLGLVSPPWPVRAAESGWRLDDSDAFCWRCGRTAGPFEVTPPQSPQPGCTQCRGKRLPWDRFVRAGEYTSELRRAIREVKFGRWRSLGRSLGHELGRALARELSWSARSAGRILLVPIPASTWRRLRSGIDHTLVLARGVQEVIGGEIVRPVRRRHGPSQLEVPPSQRSRNAARSFEAARAGPFWIGRRSVPRVTGLTTVVVIDDVRTTGATMVAACRAVRDVLVMSPGSQLSLWAAVVGVTPEPGRAVPAEEPADSLVDQLGL